MDLVLNSERISTASVISASGEVDLWSADQLRNALDEAAASGVSAVVVDLRQVTFLDSTGVGVLAGALRQGQEADRRVGLVVAGGPVEKVLAVTGMDRVFPLFTSVEDALTDLTGAKDQAD